MREIFFSAAVLTIITLQVQGHGMLWEPPNRSSLWRWDDSAPKNYEDNQVFCGGATVQWQENRGLCGPCGDNYADKQPRENENGGTYGQGTITRRYKKNTNIEIHVNITASHLGHFEFHICELKNDKDFESEECFTPNPLYFLDGSFQYKITPDLDHAQYHKLYAMLPFDLTCERCVLRWHYRAGNSYGICSDGSSALGCGAQETFRNCADISIE